MIITTKVEVTPRRIADLMVTAIEDGIGYWCKSVKLLDPDKKLFKAPWYDDERLYIETDRTILIEIKELDPHKDNAGIYQLDLEKMKRGFELMQEFGKPKGYCWRDFINENEDANTADVWFQLAVFGEVVYG